MISPRVIVAGVGTMGAAACAHIARRGADVIGLERFSIGHTFGSHSGQSRAYRLAYYEHPDYVPLLRRARELWMDINEHTGREVFCPVGGVYLAPHGADFVRIAHEAADTTYGQPAMTVEGLHVHIALCDTLSHNL